MEELKKLLQQVDDEYLVGLSNKGTLKRAYKDLEEQRPMSEWQQREVKVTLKDAVCQIRSPLGESVCSCPSRSICRHLLSAILYVKQEAGESQAQEEEETGGLEKEILEVPLEKLKRACKSRSCRIFMEHIKAGELPAIQEGKVFTVTFLGEGIVVKLLSPLEYSTCSCHSRDLCSHKAQAILAVLLSKKAITIEKMEKLLEADESIDIQKVREAADLMKETIRSQLLTGLSRLSVEAAESMERMAILSRGRNLPNFENEFRKAGSEYRMYLERKAAFRVEQLISRLLSLYDRACLLEQTEESALFRSLAGSFRDTYEPVSRLHLVSVGTRELRSKAGYEGEIYYFLEVEKREFYTWTDARPTFYEKSPQRAAGWSGQTEAPWGLGCSRKKMQELEFFLDFARTTKERKLSVSRETRSEIIGKRNMEDKKIREAVFWNYTDLLENHFGRKEQDYGTGERPALVGAKEIREVSFDSVEQRFSMELLDVEGRRLLAAVNYSAQERLTIQFLERLTRRLKKEKDKQVVFFGIPYLKNGELCLYPIECFIGEGLYAREVDVYAPKEAEEKEILFWEQNPEKEIIVRLERYLNEVYRVSGDIFHSGLSSVQEESLGEIKAMAEEGEQLGLHRIAAHLDFLHKSLEGRRHGTEYALEKLLASWIALNTCLKLCLEKTAFDQALITMKTTKTLQQFGGREG